MKKKLYLLLFLFCAYSTLSAQQQVTCGVFTFDVLITPVTCNGDCDGAIQITNISGGTPSYTTFWSTGSTVPSIFNLCADDYTIFISDAMGDTCSMTFTVPQPAPIQVSEIVTDASCPTCCDGAIVLTPTGGTPPYTYTLYDSLANSFFPPYSNLCPSTYNWCVSDANGCITCDTLVLSFPTSIISNNIVTDFSIYPNPNNGNFTIDVGNFENVTIEIYNISGQLILKELLLKSITPINLKENPKGVYFVKIATDNKAIVRKIAYQ
ncbi:MAG: T9SS type A sorting domain-containing protein [Flavobacteriales bacterium]|nr:T9SS type A sorting domain-containing protein [Flavobacteriales bacterium]